MRPRLVSAAPLDWTRREFVRGIGCGMLGVTLPGRDHWIHCQTALMAGGGIRGQLYGASDKIAAYPADRPVYAEDLAATVYQAMGIDQQLVFTDREGRTQSLLDEGQSLPLF